MRRRNLAQRQKRCLLERAVPSSCSYRDPALRDLGVCCPLNSCPGAEELVPGFRTCKDGKIQHLPERPGKEEEKVKKGPERGERRLCTSEKGPRSSATNNTLGTIWGSEGGRQKVGTLLYSSESFG